MISTCYESCDSKADLNDARELHELAPREARHDNITSSLEVSGLMLVQESLEARQHTYNASTPFRLLPSFGFLSLRRGSQPPKAALWLKCVLLCPASSASCLMTLKPPMRITRHCFAHDRLPSGLVNLSCNQHLSDVWLMHHL